MNHPGKGSQEPRSGWSKDLPPCDPLELTSTEGLPLRVDRWCPTGSAARAAVIVCHGFKGFKRWGFFPHLSRRLAEAGFEVFTLDFSRNGIGEDPEEFTRLDLFAGNTYSQELDDLTTLIAHVRERSVAGGRGLGLLGHSRGAVPVMVAARENPDVRAIVTWSGVGRLLRLSPRQLERWAEQGRLEFTNARTGQKMAMDHAFVEDLDAHAARFDLAAAAREMGAAHLLVHGDADLAVPIEEAEQLRAGRTERCRMVRVEGGSHTYGAQHPFTVPTPHLNQAIEPTIAWFSGYLADAGRGPDAAS